MNVIVEAIETFGKDNQCRIAIEEMSELTKEICKNFRGAPNVDHIAEEIADVKIMLMQLELIFDCTDKVIDWQDFKMRRLEEIIKANKKAVAR
jgi:NTP pyrophosphatase (non-canonical NTP hydrolase)